MKNLLLTLSLAFLAFNISAQCWSAIVPSHTMHLLCDSLKRKELNYRQGAFISSGFTDMKADLNSDPGAQKEIPVADKSKLARRVNRDALAPVGYVFWMVCRLVLKGKFLL